MDFQLFLTPLAFIYPVRNRDIPPDVLTLTVTVMNRGKRAKDAEVAELTVHLSNLRSGAETEDWHQLAGVTPIGEWGALRLRTRYLHDLIMPEDEYSPLKVLVLDPGLQVVRALADLCHSDRTPLASALLRIFRFDKREADLLSTLNRLEVEREDETSTLFRSASLTTTLMDLYMRSVCTEFLSTAIFPTIHRYCQRKDLNHSFLHFHSILCFVAIAGSWSRASPAS